MKCGVKRLECSVQCRVWSEECEVESKMRRAE